MTTTLEPVALDTRGLRTRLRRTLLLARSMWIGGIVLAATSAVVLVMVDAHLRDVRAGFDRYPADVVAINDGPEDDARGTATVEFVEDGKRRVVDVSVEHTDSVSLGVTTALVDPEDRSFVTLPSEPAFKDRDMLWFGAMSVSLGLVVVGLFTASTARHKTRVLAASPWQRVMGYFGPPYVVYLPHVEKGAFWVSDQRPLGRGRFSGEAAIGTEGDLVLRQPGTNRLLLARRQSAAGCWKRHLIHESRRQKSIVEIRVGRTPEERVLRFDPTDLEGADIDALLDEESVDVIFGPYETAAVRFPDSEIVRIAHVESVRPTRRELRTLSAARS
jgi:hypothetical protein